MTTYTNTRPSTIHTSNRSFYWALAITLAVLITLFFTMKTRKESIVPLAPNQAEAQASAPNESEPSPHPIRQIDPVTGQVYYVDPQTGTILNRNRYNGAIQDPRAEDLHNGANSINGVIGPNTNRESQ